MAGGSRANTGPGRALGAAPRPPPHPRESTAGVGARSRPLRGSVLVRGTLAAEPARPPRGDAPRVVTAITPVLESEPLRLDIRWPWRARLSSQERHAPHWAAAEAVGTGRSPLSRCAASPAREGTGVPGAGCPAPGAPGRAETQAGLDGAEAPGSCEPRDGCPLQSPTVPLKCYFPPEDTQTDANFCKHFGNEFSEFGLSAALNG